MQNKSIKQSPRTPPPNSRDIFSSDSQPRNYHRSQDMSPSCVFLDPRRRSVSGLRRPPNNNDVSDLQQSAVQQLASRQNSFTQPVQEESNADDLSASRPGSDRPFRLQFRRVQLSTNTQILYNRNRMAVCRALFFGILMPSPLIVLSFVYSLPLMMKISSGALMVFGIVDLGVFLLYHDRLNDMAILEGQDRRIPRGCLPHHKIGSILALIFLVLMGLAVFTCFHYNYLLSNLEISILYILLLLMYFLGLLSLKSIQVYYFAGSVVIWLILAFFLALASCFTAILTCGRYVIGRPKNYWKESSIRLYPPQVNKLRQERDGELSCAVCLEDLAPQTQILSLPCVEMKHHLFHMKCGQQWIQSHHTCPICRRDYSHYLGGSSPWMRIWLFTEKQI